MKTAAKLFTNLTNKYLPDPLVIAIGLTAFTMLLAMVIRGNSFLEVTTQWGDGFWDLLAFSMQMTVILVAGYILAKTPMVDRGLTAIAHRVTSPRAAIIVATLVGGVGSWLNWGFGLVLGGLMAQKLALNVKGLHYPLAIAAGYSGFALYGVGLSGSVPLLIATPGHFLEDQIGLIDLGRTIFDPVILGMVVVLLIGLPLFNAALHPKDPADVKEIDPTTVAPAPEKLQADKSGLSVGERLNASPVFSIGIGALALIYLVQHFARGGGLDLNTVNFALLFLGILFLTRPMYFLDTLNDGIRLAAGIVVQYPFYAGIMGILMGSGLVVTFAAWIGDISSAETLPFLSFLSGGLINLLAPSGGGQWAVQGPVMIEAANQLDADYAKTALGVQIGDQWTNMVQPFWILPVLAISKLKLGEVMGYLVLILVFIGVVFGAAVLLWGFLG
ncbi:short-chain fatty acid transporter [Kocuria rosea subsp. polaris]|uniref:Short-chain fatty acid transporter n=1 Tax=Kocuria rosea subsp. polaris TaxID=136273 RepID=A0A0W8IMH9_KOCRO|nr:TIGR00366 family protein [Kocuria polaris]KUG61474.1 short-chain fatty acid transporter [Kocuria polaris]